MLETVKVSGVVDLWYTRLPSFELLLQYAICCYFDIARYTTLSRFRGIHQLEGCYRRLGDYFQGVETVIFSCGSKPLFGEAAVDP